MTVPDPNSILEWLIWAKAGAMSAFGGMVAYLIEVSEDKEKRLTAASYLIALVVAFFVGMILDDWLPPDMWGRGGFLLVAGTIARPILRAMQRRVVRYIDRMDGGSAE